MNFKNLAENLIIVIVSALIGGLIGYNASVYSNEQTIQLLIPTIEQAIDKETIKNEITHDVKVEIAKVKKSDSINININQAPNTTQKPINIIKKDSFTPKKNSWFSRTFGKKTKR